VCTIQIIFQMMLNIVIFVECITYTRLNQVGYLYHSIIVMTPFNI